MLAGPAAIHLQETGPAATTTTFDVFSGVVNDINHVLITYINSTSAEVINIAMPIIAVAAVIWIWIYGIKTALGLQGSMPVADFLWKAFRMSLVIGLAGSASAYQSGIARVVMQTPNELANLLVNNASGSVTTSTAPDLVDKALAAGFHVAGVAFANASILSAAGWGLAIMGAIMIIGTVILGVVAGGILIMVQIGLAILVALGPAFILCYIFDATRQYTANWIGQVLGYALLLVMFSAVLGLFLNIFQGYVNNIRVDNVQNLAADVGGTLFLAMALAFLLFESPRKAAALANGLALGSGAAFGMALLAGRAIGAAGAKAAAASMAPPAAQQQSKSASQTGGAGLVGPGATRSVMKGYYRP